MRDERVVGLVQHEEEVEPHHRHAGLDILVDQRGHHRLDIDPAADNEATVRLMDLLAEEPIRRP